MDQILWVVEIYNCEDLPFHEFVPIYENPSEPPPPYIACHEGPEEAEGKYYYGVLRHGKKLKGERVVIDILHE